MTRKGRFGCAECSKKRRGKSFTQGVVKKVGSLAETMPELSKEWHPTKNGDLTPNDITAGKFKPVWWLCPKCGYEWQASPNNRKRGIGCPCCSGRVPKTGVNDLETLYATALCERLTAAGADVTLKQYSETMLRSRAINGRYQLLLVSENTLDATALPDADILLLSAEEMEDPSCEN